MSVSAGSAELHSLFFCLWPRFLMTVLQKLWLDNHKKTSKTVLSGRFRVTSFVLLIFFRWKVKTLLEMLKCVLCRNPPPNHWLKHIKFVRSLFEFPPFATCKGENKTETHHSPRCDTCIRTLRKTWPEVGADVFWMLFEW